MVRATWCYCMYAVFISQGQFPLLWVHAYTHQPSCSAAAQCYECILHIPLMHSNFTTTNITHSVLCDHLSHALLYFHVTARPACGLRSPSMHPRYCHTYNIPLPQPHCVVSRSTMYVPRFIYVISLSCNLFQVNPMLILDICARLECP